LQSYKCINGDFDAPSLYGTQLLDAIQAQTNPQYLIIRGKVTFTADYTFAAGSEIIFLDNNSGLRVSNGMKLTLQQSHLHGCTKLWAGIEVLPSAKIKANGCTFEDAQAAIRLRHLTMITATNNTFRKNICGILCLSNITGSSILLESSMGISGNTFWGNDKLVEPGIPASIDPNITFNSPVPTNPTEYPHSGIWVERMSTLDIGEQSEVPTGGFNVFRDFGQNDEFSIWTYGVFSLNTNITIKHSRFENFGIYDPLNSSNTIEESWAVHTFTNTMATTTTVVTGLNQTVLPPLAAPATFSNCVNDIWTLGTNLAVTDVTSYKALSSIKAGMFNSGQNPIVCEIKNNAITYFRGRGIQIRFFKPIQLKIQGNLISDNDELDDPLERIGVLIDAGGMTEIPLLGSQVSGNTIIARSPRVNAVFWGIVIVQTSDLTIVGNKIYGQYIPTNLLGFTGIRTRLASSNGLKIRYNNISGAGINYQSSPPLSGPGFASGIYLFESLNSVVECNTTGETNTGIVFLSICDNTDFRSNSMYRHGIGLALGHPDISNAFLNQIGLQINKENRWHGTNSPIEAFAHDLGSALASKFEINSSLLGSAFWPSPRKIGTMNDIFTWFVPSTTGTEANESTVACLTPAPDEPEEEVKLAHNDFKILEGTYQPPLNYPAMDWEARWHFADRLKQNPVLQSINSEVAQYHQNTYNASYSVLNGSYRKYLNRWQPTHPLTASVQSQTLALNEAVAQRFDLDMLLSESVEENTTLHAQMLAADQLIQSLSHSLELSIEGLNGATDEEMVNLLAELEGATFTEVYETDMKAVLVTLLQSHLWGDAPLTTEQTARIETIANKCRCSGGYTVVLARGILKQKEFYSQDSDCETPPQLGVNHQATTQFAPEPLHLFPNPADQTLTIRINEEFEMGTVKLYNTQGILLDHFSLQGQSTLLLVNNLRNGVYLLEVLLDTKTSIRKTFVVIH